MSLLSLGATTVADYRVHTGDTTTAASAVSAALLEAESLLEEELRRGLALEARTETLKVYPDGRVYPPAWPITAASLTIDGRSLLGATPDISTFTGLIDAPRPWRVATTWTGGFDASTLPVTLEHAIYDLAQGLVASSPVPVGATSVSLGDASVSFAAPSGGGVDAIVPGLSARVGRYANRWAA